MKLKDLSPEMKEKVDACETIEELTELAEAEGIELSEEDLDAIAGGKQKKIYRARPRPFKKKDPTYQPDVLPSKEEVDEGDAIRVF